MYVWTAYKSYYSNLPNITNVFQSYDVLLKWHILDKPDALEGNRNNYAQTSMQKNRNPFVDHPEYAWKIFGENCSSDVLNLAKQTYPDENESEGPIEEETIDTALKWSNVFLEKTGSICNIDGNTDLDELKKAWIECEKLYQGLSIIEQQYVLIPRLMEDDDEKKVIVNAKNRYDFITKKYDSLDKFIDTPVHKSNKVIENNNYNSLYIIISISGIFMCSMSLKIIYEHKRKRAQG